MKVRPFRSIGGLTLHTYDPDQRETGHGNVTMHIPRDALSVLAVQAMAEIGMDASEELIQACRDLVAASEPPKDSIPAWCRIPDEDAETLIELEMDIIRDDMIAYARAELDKMSMTEVARRVLENTIGPDDPGPTDEDVDQGIKENVK